MFPADYYCHFSERVKHGYDMISCSNKNTENYACDEHSHLVHDQDVALDMYHHIKSYMVDNIKIYYKENEDAKGKRTSALSCKKIYDFLFEHPIFLVKNHDFLITSYNKLVEFKEISSVEDYFNVPVYIDKFKQLTGIACLGPYILPEQAIPLELKEKMNNDL